MVSVSVGVLGWLVCLIGSLIDQLFHGLLACLTRLLLTYPLAC